MRFFILVLLLPHFASGIASIECPSWFHTNGFMNDLGALSEAVSSGESDVQGMCGLYNVVRTCEGAYETRMRIYQLENDPEVMYVVFRPPQPSPEGQSIHANPRMVPCIFHDHCEGLIVERIQEAFMDLWDGCADTLLDQSDKRLYVGGHSLGGVFSMLLTNKIWRDHRRLPEISIGFGSPFVGDVLFGIAHDMKDVMADSYWHVETVDRWDYGHLDSTVERYNNPMSYVVHTDICGLITSVLPDSYGMHDLRNYRATLAGSIC